ncbi:hypothetical protein [Pseudoxanthomonas sp.]|uniref:hypothetical protein n=1 Tax=Pseudoxanthomonas sp. TaxID=1871049 RepID=UPI00262D4E2F|nr:hypothetical protein [Pseudoxanthomonas sp.]WDS36194.1 MAG: hypothetical protein O8I58_18315 [Pseudoxanthomonas sp.]
MSTEETVTAYITKYAAAKGGRIIKKQLTRYEDSKTRVYDRFFNSFSIGKDAFLTEPDAQDAVKSLIEKKIKSHEKTIAILKKMANGPAPVSEEA